MIVVSSLDLESLVKSTIFVAICVAAAMTWPAKVKAEVTAFENCVVTGTASVIVVRIPLRSERAESIPLMIEFTFALNSRTIASVVELGGELGS